MNAPNTVIVHLGTNDIETQTPEDVHANLLQFKFEVEEKFQCRTLISSILPRSDHLQNAFTRCKDLLFATIPDDVIAHQQIDADA